ncbi:Hypothetical predicted protein, partial [Olea europaea subsp. europaea]
MYDDLFKKYMKVVFRRNDQKPASAEVDDDAENLACKLFPSMPCSDVQYIVLFFELSSDSIVYRVQL